MVPSEAEGWKEPVPGPSAVWRLLVSGVLCILGILWLQGIPHASLLPDASAASHVHRLTIDDRVASGIVQADAHVRELTSGQIASALAPALANVSCVAGTGSARTVPPDASGTCPPHTVWRGQFSYTGHRLWFQLARGDDPAHLSVHVGGNPASELNHRMVRRLSSGEAAGYLPLLSPFEHAFMRPEQEWVLVHVAAAPGTYPVTYEIRGEIALGQGSFIQAAGVDLPFAAGWPRSPGWLLLLGGFLGLALHLLAMDPWPRVFRFPVTAGVGLRHFGSVLIPNFLYVQGIGVLCALVLVGVGIRTHLWWLSLPGLLGLGLIGLKRPAWWLGALLFGLPFYLHPVPLAPGFALNLIEIGVWGGAGLALLHTWHAPLAAFPARGIQRVGLALLGLLLVGLFSAVDSAYPALALREWRTVFLAGFVFLLALVAILQHSRHRDQDILLLLVMWMAGAVAISLFGYYAYVEGINVTDVQGVRRVRGLYGSPNNLALYLERTVLVCLALFVFASSWRRRLLWGLALVIQGGAVLLTFSKGALLLGLPAGVLVLLVITLRQAYRWPEARRVLGLLAVAALVGIALLLPFLGTPRFAGLLNVQESFPNLVRLHLWRSGWHMFLDHWLVGAGPDNFLYLYRSFYLAPEVWNEPSLNHPHNLFIDLMSRLGILGVLGGLAFWLVGMRQLYARITEIPSNKAALGFLAAAVAGLCHGQVDASYALPDIMLVWVLLFGLWCFPYPVHPPDPLLN